MFCLSFIHSLCLIQSLIHMKLLDYLKHIHFTNDFGEETKFDRNGDPVAMYDLINWQLIGNGEVRYATVGRFDETMQPKLVIEEKNIIWNGNQRQVMLQCELYFTILFAFPPYSSCVCWVLVHNFMMSISVVCPFSELQVPTSVCSTSCPPGTRKATRPNFPLCCFDCIICAAGEVSNQTGMS